MLQIIDISQKILYDMAMGEKKLVSVINATVSHEMRNPINAIRVQVKEMESLNKTLKDKISAITEESVEQSKQALEKIYE